MYILESFGIGFGSGLATWILWKMSHQYKCQCGAEHFFFSTYKKHVLMKHGVV